MTTYTENPKLSNRFAAALVYATQLHNRQIRKGSGIPYISHLLSVAALVLEDGGDENEAIAALLHDAIEDQGGQTRAEIRQRFGEKVVTIVDGCTDSETIPKPPWKERKLNYLEKMRSASKEVQRVALADKVHNARSIVADWEQTGEKVWQKFKGGKEGTLWFYRSFLEVYQQQNSSWLTQELARLIARLEDG